MENETFKSEISEVKNPYGDIEIAHVNGKIELQTPNIEEPEDVNTKTDLVNIEDVSNISKTLGNLSEKIIAIVSNTDRKDELKQDTEKVKEFSDAILKNEIPNIDIVIESNNIINELNIKKARDEYDNNIKNKRKKSFDALISDKAVFRKDKST